MNEIHLTVSLEEEKLRLDKYLSEELSAYSRNFIRGLIEDGKVFVNSKGAKPSKSLKDNDEITVFIEDPKEIEIPAVDIPVEILYEDKDLLVVNKPKGMPVHPSNGHLDDTLVNSLLYTHKDRLSGINGIIRPGIVHRIDMDTTGSLIVCKNDASHNFIAAQIKEHSVNRIYEAVLQGALKEDGTVDKPIGRDKKDRKKMAICPDGKEAVTNYKILDYNEEYTHGEFKLLTGRTHQIRVHMASLNHPVLGDKVYGPKKCPFNLQGQSLHARTIGFIRPSDKKYIEVTAPLPDYFKKLLEACKLH